VPELPEVENARQLIAGYALDRLITGVDDTDTYETRPHTPGELRDALLGRRLTAVHRRGKTMWCETSGTGRSRTPGPDLGIHLGMSGRIIIVTPEGATVEGGDGRRSRSGSGSRWSSRTAAGWPCPTCAGSGASSWIRTWRRWDRMPWR
jgi:formamidopyrimidine-DNA glycosylase